MPMWPFSKKKSDSQSDEAQDLEPVMRPRISARSMELRRQMMLRKVTLQLR